MLSRLPLVLALALPSTPSALDTLRDTHRVLLVFGPNSLDPRTRSQLAALDGKALAERDVILITELEAWQGKDSTLQIHRTAFNTDAEQTALRRRFHIVPGTFTVLLLGKDGGEKLRAHTPITTVKLNQLIDAMPMRQQEMKQRSRP